MKINKLIVTGTVTWSFFLQSMLLARRHSTSHYYNERFSTSEVIYKSLEISITRPTTEYLGLRSSLSDQIVNEGETDSFGIR